MHIPFYKQLWFEVLVRISVVIGIIIFATFYYLINYQKKSLIQHERELASHISVSIERAMYYAMEKNDLQIIENMVDKIVQSDDKGGQIKTIRLLDKKGKILVSSKKEEKGAFISKEAGLCESCHDGSRPRFEKFAVVERNNTITVVNLLFNGPDCMMHHAPAKKILGAIVIDLSSDPLAEMLKNSFYRMVLSAVIAFIVMMILVFAVITLLVTCPIKDLMKAMIDAAKGNLNVTVKIPSGNEVGVLAKTFNFMLQKIRDLHESDLRKEHEIAKMQESLRYKAELEALNAQLEARVVELEAANRQIEMMVKEVEEKNFHLEKAIDRLRILYKISRCLTTVLNPDDVIKMIVEKSVSIMKAKTGSLMLLDKEKGELYIKYAIGIDPEIVEKTRVKLGESISGWVAKEGKPVIVKDIETDERFKRMSKSHYETKSLISSPVIVKGEVVGVLNVNNKVDGTEFTEDELELLNTLAGQTAVSLENAKLYLDLQKSYFDTIRALVNAIEAKDPYTRGHSERVTCYSLEMGKRLNLSPKRLEILQHAAILHDIGKIGTDLNILHKNGLLTDEEFEVIKEHPLIGSQIIEPVAFLQEVKAIITEHHERFDGKGYPQGKKGEELSLEARIISIADAFDAMISDRPYRKAMPIEAAMEELRRCAGTQFDPKLVEIFCQMILENPACLFI